VGEVCCGDVVDGEKGWSAGGGGEEALLHAGAVAEEERHGCRRSLRADGGPEEKRRGGGYVASMPGRKGIGICTRYSMYILCSTPWSHATPAQARAGKAHVIFQDQSDAALTPPRPPGETAADVARRVCLPAAGGMQRRAGMSREGGVSRHVMLV